MHYPSSTVYGALVEMRAGIRIRALAADVGDHSQSRESLQVFEGEGEDAFPLGREFFGECIHDVTKTEFLDWLIEKRIYCFLELLLL